MEYNVRYKPGVDRIKLAKWLRTLKHVGSPSMAYNIADRMIAGESFRFHLKDSQLPDASKIVLGDICTAPAEHAKRQALTKRVMYLNLRDRGAKGELDAAIAWCKYCKEEGIGELDK